MEKLLKVKEVAEALGCRTETVLRYIGAGKLSALRTPAGHYRVREGTVRDFLQPVETHSESDGHADSK